MLGQVTYILFETPDRAFLALPGDVLLAYKAHARFQKINNIIGAPVTHASIAFIRPDGSVATVEMGQVGLFGRTIDEFVPNYTAIAVVHLDVDPAQRARLVAEASAGLSERALEYTYAQCVLIGFWGLVRRITPRFLEPLVTLLVLMVASVAYVVHGGRRTTCSGALAQMLSAVGIPPVLAVPSHAPVPFRDRGDLGALRFRPRRILSERWRGPWNVVVSPSDLAVTVPSSGISVLRAVADVERPRWIARLTRRRRRTACEPGDRRTAHRHGCEDVATVACHGAGARPDRRDHGEREEVPELQDEHVRRAGR